MPNTDQSGYKARLVQKCIGIIQDRIQTASKAMENAQAAANGEEKSSAGDKYETARAMSHLEKDMYASQLSTNRKELAQLMDINYKLHSETVIAGSIIECASSCFFIAAGIGKLVMENKSVYVISPGAPLSKILTGKKKGESFLFNKQEHRVVSIY